MLFIKNLGVSDPYFNLASEEYILETMNESGSIFMLWQNGPSVILGANQNAYAEINLEYAGSHNIKIAKRLSGGGCVYHDLGNINFSFFENIGDAGEDGGKILNFEYFVLPVVSALKNLGLEADLQGRNDLLLCGAKISGNAQRVYKNRAGTKKIMHHGTILFDSDLNRLKEVLNPDKQKIKSGGIKSKHGRVTNIRPHLERDMRSGEFMDYLKTYILREKTHRIYEFDRSDIKNIELTAEKYASPEFIFGSKIKYEFTNKKRFGFGTVELNFDVKDFKMQNIKIYGDFFGEEDIAGLENSLNGIFHNAGAVKTALEDKDIDRYIKGCSQKDLLGMII
ncbi:MAG: lipoate--protein ligase [Oscillospiraceae bacterium]|nr:lipoate--protein ligase [Oscillospiraceae bacterium]